MTRGFTRTVETEVAAPATAIYELVADVSRHGEWAGNPLTVRHIHGPTHGPGARFATRAGKVLPVVPKSMDGTVVVVAAERPRTVVYDAHDEGGRYRWTFTLEPAPGGTRVSHTVDRRSGLPPVVLLQPLMWRLFGRRQVERGLRRLASVVETRLASVVETRKEALRWPS